MKRASCCRLSFQFLFFSSLCTFLTLPSHCNTLSSSHLSPISFPFVVPIDLSHHITLRAKIFSFPSLSSSNPSKNSNSSNNYQTFLKISQQNQKNGSSLFSLSLDSHTRIPYFTSQLLNCSSGHRLYAKTTQDLILQMSLENSHLIIFFFIDGILRNKCVGAVRMNQISLFEGLGDMEYNLDHPFLVTNISYFPYLLPFHQIQQQSLLNPSSSRMKTQQVSVDDLGSSTLDQSSTPTTTTALILFWPSFYSLFRTPPSQEWQVAHLIESLSQLLEDLLTNSSPNTLFYIIIPFTSSLSQRILDQFSSYQTISITFIDLTTFTPTIDPTSSTQRPYSSSSSPSYPHFINFIFYQLQNLKIFLENLFTSRNGFLSLIGSQCHPENWYPPHSSRSQNDHNLNLVILLISSHIFPSKNLISGLIFEILTTEKKVLIGGTILNLRHEIESFGYEFYELPYTGGLDQYLLPHGRYRGYQIPHHPQHHQTATTLAISRNLMGFTFQTWKNLKNPVFLSEMSPGFDDFDFCFSASFHDEVSILVTNQSQGISLEELWIPEFQSNQLTSERYDPIHLLPSTLQALTVFTERWKEMIRKEISSRYLTSLRVTWVIHCGGSQGLEAATILQSLHKLVNIRTLIRNYKFCEHVDTISGPSLSPSFLPSPDPPLPLSSGMPGYFRDILEMTALKTFTPLYQVNLISPLFLSLHHPSAIREIQPSQEQSLRKMEVLSSMPETIVKWDAGFLKILVTSLGDTCTRLIPCPWLGPNIAMPSMRSGCHQLGKSLLLLQLV
jgi:hypothetical protein